MIAKRNARRVTIGGVRFLYKVSTTPSSRGVYDLNITVQNERHNGSKLVVEGLIQKDSAIWPLKDGDLHHYPNVTRHEIEWLVHNAIAKGWDHASNGPNVILAATNDMFRLTFLAEQAGKYPNNHPAVEAHDEKAG